MKQKVILLTVQQISNFVHVNFKVGNLKIRNSS